MHLRSLILPALCLSLAAQAPQSLAGHWEGGFQMRGGPVFVVMDLKQDGAWSGVLELPDEESGPLRLQELRVEEGALAFKVNYRGHASFEGRLSADGARIEGSLATRRGELALSFYRDRAPEQVRDPLRIRERYTKREVMIPMRDGVKLFTSIYEPKDGAQAHPILLQRTPYDVSPYGADRYRRSLGPSKLFADQGYIVVYQDVRGRWKSEGDFVDMRPEDHEKTRGIDEATDTYDTIDWLVKNLPRNNGKVGMWGISYPGYYTACGMISGHPALKAVSPQAPMDDLWVGDDAYHHGTFQLAANFDFFTFFKSERSGPSSEEVKPLEIGDPDGYSWYLKLGSVANASPILKGWTRIFDEYMNHTAYDAYWQPRNLRPHLVGVKPAVLTVGGWFDAEDLFGALHTYDSVEKQNPGADNRLVMGPWSHGQWAGGDGSSLGEAHFGSRTGDFFQKEIELPFFNHHLKGEADPKLAEATVFATGANEWKRFDAWPPREARPASLFFEAKGGLSFAPPPAAGDPRLAFEEFVSDPAHPVPYTQQITFGYAPTYMTEDQRFAATRQDVLVFETAPLTEDLTLAGPVKPVLEVSTTGTDSDWVVKLIDVQPADTPDPEDTPAGWHLGGAQMLVRGDAFRGKYRNSYAKPEPFVPGQMAKVAFELTDVCHTFKKGHRIMVQLQCSWFPIADRNPQTFCDIPYAKPEDFKKATQRVYFGGADASRLDVLILK